MSLTAWRSLSWRRKENRRIWRVWPKDSDPRTDAPIVIDMDEIGGPIALKRFFKELFFVVVIVAVCMLLNPAEVLKQPA